MTRFRHGVAASVSEPIRFMIGLLTLAATLLAADQKETSVDSIAAAKSAFQTLKAGTGVPGADKQGMPSVEAPAMIIPQDSSAPTVISPNLNRDPVAAARAVQSGRGYMLDLLMKQDANTVQTGADLLNGGGSPGTLSLASPATGPAIAAPTADAPNPFADSLAAWLSPRDFSLLVGPSGGTPASADTPGAAPQPRAIAAEPRENPFLANLSLPSMTIRNDSGLTISSPPPAPPRQPDPPPVQTKQEPPVDLSKRQSDSRYFPQINRF